MDIGRRKTHVRVALRVAGTSLAALVALGLAPAVAAAAPTNAQLAAAAAAAKAVEDRINGLATQLTAAQDTVDLAHAESTIALDDYQATQAALEAAQQQAATAQATAVQAAVDLGVARSQVVDFARRSYMEGSTYAGAAALITATDPGELIERTALLEAAGSHRSDVLDTVTVVQEQAAQADEAARTAVVEVTVLEQQAATGLAAAQAAEIAAREQASQLVTAKAQLETELATAKQELVALVGAREAADRAARVETPPPPPAPVAPPIPPVDEQAGPGNSSAAQVAIDAAMGHLGLPYAWGGGGSRGPGPGQDPDLGIVGFDCSGLTQFAYHQAGITIPRNSRAQYASLPKVVGDDLRPGDLVFWATSPSNPGTIHHVAIYLGGGQMVEAPESGDVVKVSTMRWKGFAGAVRPSA